MCKNSFEVSAVPEVIKKSVKLPIDKEDEIVFTSLVKNEWITITRKIRVFIFDFPTGKLTEIYNTLKKGN